MNDLQKKTESKLVDIVSQGGNFYFSKDKIKQFAKKNYKPLLNLMGGVGLSYYVSTYLVEHFSYLLNTEPISAQSSIDIGNYSRNKYLSNVFNLIGSISQNEKINLRYSFGVVKKEDDLTHTENSFYFKVKNITGEVGIIRLGYNSDTSTPYNQVITSMHEGYHAIRNLEPVDPVSSPISIMNDIQNHQGKGLYATYIEENSADIFVVLSLAKLATETSKDKDWLFYKKAAINLYLTRVLNSHDVVHNSSQNILPLINYYFSEQGQKEIKKEPVTNFLSKTKELFLKTSLNQEQLITHVYFEFSHNSALNSYFNSLNQTSISDFLKAGKETIQNKKDDYLIYVNELYAYKFQMKSVDNFGLRDKLKIQAMETEFIKDIPSLSSVEIDYAEKTYFSLPEIEQKNIANLPTLLLNFYKDNHVPINPESGVNFYQSTKPIHQ